jgi:hypothetical protein
MTSGIHNAIRDSVKEYLTQRGLVSSGNKQQLRQEFIRPMIFRLVEYLQVLHIHSQH